MLLTFKSCHAAALRKWYAALNCPQLWLQAYTPHSSISVAWLDNNSLSVKHDNLLERVYWICSGQFKLTDWVDGGQLAEEVCSFLECLVLHCFMISSLSWWSQGVRYLFFHRLRLSMEHHEWISTTAIPCGEALFLFGTRISLGSLHLQREPVMTRIRSQVLTVVSPPPNQWARPLFLLHPVGTEPKEAAYFAVLGGVVERVVSSQYCWHQRIFSDAFSPSSWLTISNLYSVSFPKLYGQRWPHHLTPLGMQFEFEDW